MGYTIKSKLSASSLGSSMFSLARELSASSSRPVILVTEILASLRGRYGSRRNAA